MFEQCSSSVFMISINIFIYSYNISFIYSSLLDARLCATCNGRHYNFVIHTNSLMFCPDIRVYDDYMCDYSNVPSSKKHLRVDNVRYQSMTCRFFIIGYH